MKKPSKKLLSSLFLLFLVSLKLKPEVVTLGDKQYFKEDFVPSGVLKTKHLFEIEEQLYSGKSDFQEIEVIKTPDFGKMLVLDGIVQTSEVDEFVYHENIVHLPMFYHSKPEKILIIGGGDGGSLREVLKHPIQDVYLVDIDEKVIEISKKYLPTLSNGAFENEKAIIIIENGKEFVKKHKDFFDVIILDLSDPAGPAEDLISKEFYTDVKNALKKDGIISVQSESLTEQPKLVAKINKRLKNVFSSVKVHQAVILSYQGGIYSFTVASNFDLNKITLEQIKKKYKELNLDLKYYHPAIHFSSAILPIYLEKLLE